MYSDITRLTAADAQLGASAAAVYTASSRTQIGTILLHNTAEGAENVRLLDNGTTAAHRFLNITLAGNETYEFSPKVPITLESGETLQGLTTTAATVNIKVYGRVSA